MNLPVLSRQTFHILVLITKSPLCTGALVLEAILLQDIKLKEYNFIRNGKKPNFITIRESIGESVPQQLLRCY